MYCCECFCILPLYCWSGASVYCCGYSTATPSLCFCAKTAAAAAPARGSAQRTRRVRRAPPNYVLSPTPAPALLVPPSASERLVGFTETRERIARKRPAAGEAPIDLTVSDDEAGGEQQQGERVPLADAFAVAAGTSSVPIPVD